MRDNNLLLRGCRQGNLHNRPGDSDDYAWRAGNKQSVPQLHDASEWLFVDGCSEWSDGQPMHTKPRTRDRVGRKYIRVLDEACLRFGDYQLDGGNALGHRNLRAEWTACR